jgi:hypothetical protein
MRRAPRVGQDKAQSYANPVFVKWQDVRFGSNSEVELVDADFRSAPDSGHPAGGLGCPSSAKGRPNVLPLAHREMARLCHRSRIVPPL